MLTRRPMTYTLRWICPLRFLWGKSPARLANEVTVVPRMLWAGSQNVPARSWLLAHVISSQSCHEPHKNPTRKCATSIRSNALSRQLSWKVGLGLDHTEQV